MLHKNRSAEILVYSNQIYYSNNGTSKHNIYMYLYMFYSIIGDKLDETMYI